jgi:putative glutamine amidotransferase
MSARPVLGIVCCHRIVGVEVAQAVMNRYVTSAMRFGDVAALLIPSLPDLMSADEVVSRLDGLLLTGSPSNLEAARYGQGAAADAEGPFDPARDAMSLDLIARMLDLGRPVLGICRGFQEINVALGGTLRRDVSRSPQLLAHHAPADVAFDGLFAHEHEVDLAADGILRAAFGRDRITVNSVHFQGVDQLGAGLRVEARAPDGLVEAVSADMNGVAILAVQWHPEWRSEENRQSQAFFRLLGRALRGEPLASDLRMPV